ncbi:MAG TPA: hypothetical protein VGD00_10395, partial [Solirubrobacteraceae bacterium]
NSHGKASATSPETGITGGGETAPENIVTPQILGLAVAGQELTATEGTWKGTSPTYAFQWQLCNASGGECEEIGGATSSKFTIPDSDAGHALRVTVTASNGAGEASATSSPSSEIVGVAPTNTELPVVSGEAKEGQILTATSGKWSGTEPITFEYEWLRCNTTGGACTTAQAPSVLSAYTAQAADVGHTLRVNVLAKDIAGSGEAESEPTATVTGKAPANTLAPSVLGLAVTGQTLTASEGVWTGTAPISYTFQWQQCSKAGTGCEDITGAASSTYKVADGDAGHTLRVVVSAKNVSGTTEKESSTTSEVLGVGPKNTEAPSISGEAKEGQVLTASGGKWSGTEPVTLEYEWLRCNTSGAACTQAAAPSALPTYSVVAADVGHRLRVNVLAKNVAGSSEQESAPTASVAGIAPFDTVAPSVLGLAVTGQTLTANEGLWTGTAPITYAFQWQQCSKAGTGCTNVTGENKSTYVIRDADAAHKLRVVVTAKNVAGTTEKESATTAEVAGVAPNNTEVPSVSGTPTAGQSLTAASGKWSGTEPITFEYEWLRCNTEGKACAQAATPSVLTNYTIQPADVGHTLRVKVIATNVAGKGEKESNATATVGGVKPSNSVAPTVVGVAVTGQELTATEGTWTGTEPIAYAFRWQQCTSSGTECADVSGASTSKYVVKDADAGHRLRVVVTAKNVAGSTEKESATTAEVQGVKPTNTEAPKVSGTTTESQSLTASSGKWSGTEPITFEYEWLRCNVAGAECSTAQAPSVLATYTLVVGDIGHKMRAKVIAKNIAGTASMQSEPTAEVAGIKPTNTVLPLIVGVAGSGLTVEAKEGTWTGSQPITYEYEWKICTTATSCKVEQKSTNTKFTIPALSATKKLRLNVIAKNVAGIESKEALEQTILT